jgi:hypothetical protein
MDGTDETGRDRAPDARPRRVRTMAVALAVVLLGTVVAVLAWRHDPGLDVRRGTTTTPDVTIDPVAPGPPRRRAASEPPDLNARSDTRAPAPIAEGTTAVSIEVVTEDGRACGEGTVAFKAPDLQLMERGMAPLKYLGDASLAAGNPVVLRDLPDSMDGLDVEATATVPGLAVASARLTIGAHRVTSVRLTVSPGRQAEVRVLDSGTDAPVADASVVSLTDAARRRVDVKALRGSDGAGVARSDAEGRCVVGGLGSGAHEFEIDAPGYRRGTVKWSEGVVTVRLDRVQGTGTVSVTVIDPDGHPAPGIVVEQVQSDRTATTGADGRARFDEVPVGLAFFRFDLPVGDDFDRWQAKLDAGLQLLAEVEVAPGGSHEVELGMRRAAASFEGRLVAEDGSPIAGVSITLMADLGIHRVTTDEAGYVRLPDVAPSKMIAFVDLDTQAHWIFDEFDVKAGEHATATWTVGSATLRGRVVRGTERTPVADAVVHASGPLSGRATTDVNGTFAFGRARTGTYRVSVDAPSAPGYAARPVDVTLPTDKATVIEFVQCGDIVVRFLPGDRASLRQAKIVLTSAAEAPPAFEAAETGDGDLVARSVLPGRYEVVVELAGRRRTFPAEVKAGSTTVVEVGSP